MRNSPRRSPDSLSRADGSRPAPADLDIGVIYTHERHLMGRLLETLRASGEGLRLRLILVDNASRDGVGRWANYFARTLVVRNERRLLYAANLNRILSVADSPLVLLLNTDMYFDPQEQCLAKMVRFMEAHPDCGVAGCRLHHADGSHAPSARRFQTPGVILARRLGLGGLLRRSLDAYFYREHAADGCWECDWLSGCFLLLRREAVQQVGLFDTRYGKYFEDVDMCLRMARAGWRVMYNGATYCYHLEQRASRRVFSIDAARHLRAYLRWLLKWGPAPAARRADRPGGQLRRAA